ncbi:MAG: GNAT family N-acetyltransferase [Myxococcota bacterium]
MIHRFVPAESSDFDQLWALHRQSHRGFVEQGGESWNEAQQRVAFTRAFATQDMQRVEVDGETVGMLSVAWDESPVVVHAVELWPQWQGRGLGTRLVHDVLLRAQQLECGVEVEVHAANPARALFERLGFKPTTATATHQRLAWAQSIRTQVTLEAAMSPWLDEGRRRAWARRLFETAPDRELEFIRFAAGRHGLADEATVLDAEAGTGRRLPGLAARGWQVTALCPDADYAKAAQRVSARVRSVVQVHTEGIEALEDDGRYDLAIAFEGALWSRLTHEARVAAARRLRTAVRPGGLLVVEGPNSLAVLHAGGQPPVRTELYHRAQVSQIPRLDLDTHDGVATYRDAIGVDIDGVGVADWVERRQVALMGLPLLRVALVEAGWEGVEVYRDLDGTGPARVSGPTVVLTATAPDRRQSPG